MTSFRMCSSRSASEDSSTTRIHGGLGIGLALVRQLVELHGGKVRAESPGKKGGSTFTVSLPVAAPRSDSGAQRAEGGDPDASAVSSLRGTRVLVIDDDADSLEMLAMMLSYAGADVRTASSAFLAYDMIEAWRPNVVLTDLTMPGEDGFMLQDTMRTIFTRRGDRVPIIAVTANGTAEYRERALRAGFDLYLTKPIDPPRLTSAVAEVARRAS